MDGRGRQSQAKSVQGGKQTGGVIFTRDAPLAGVCLGMPGSPQTPDYYLGQHLPGADTHDLDKGHYTKSS